MVLTNEIQSKIRKFINNKHLCVTIGFKIRLSLLFKIYRYTKLRAICRGYDYLRSKQRLLNTNNWKTDKRRKDVRS